VASSPSAAFTDGRRLRIDSRHRYFPDLRALFRAKQLLVLLSRRSITVKYRQTLLGTIWVFGGPIVSAGLFTFVFGNVAKLPSNGVPYFAFSYAGLLSWNVFSNVLSNASTSLTTNSTLITKIYFPRLVLPLSSIAPVIINLGISFVIMLVILLLYGIPVTVNILLLPFWLLLAFMLSMGLGLILGAASVPYRDVNYLTPMFTQIVMYLSPVAYSTEAVPAHLQKFFLLNPITTIVEGTRWSVLGNAHISKWALVYTIVLSVGTLVGGMSFFSRLESSIADVV
jgi:lipopolysaccharide transport system permease protein